MLESSRIGTASVSEDGNEHNYSRRAICDEQRHHLRKAEGYSKKQQNQGMNDMLSEDATMHGNRPSKGAQQDAEIKADEAEIIRKKQEKTDTQTLLEISPRSTAMLKNPSPDRTAALFASLLQLADSNGPENFSIKRQQCVFSEEAGRLI
ncbi:hypothetical protein F5Y12DRAFT_716915 [Xylaria sp. FL1777]|nr:hypothetical protein F5Y12DRAFT_716915 [Xylaria sp. FL1777]